MALSFELQVESDTDVEQFLAAVRDERYWHARLAQNTAGTATLDALVLDDSGGVDVLTTHSLVRGSLPRVVQRVIRGDMTMVHKESWRRLDDSSLTGELSAEMHGMPVSADGTVTLLRSSGGSLLSYAATVSVKIPLVGSALENLVKTQLVNGVDDMTRFTTAWIAENG